ncbi:MAG: polyprenyl synthetase family protein [Chloroflexota bacterium]
MTAQQLTSQSPSDTADTVETRLLEIIDKALEAVDQAMYDAVDSEVEVLRDASRHILQSGGKRVRPRLMMLSFAATGGADLLKAVQPAAAIELMHTASVVHDDINDHGVMRRGRPSVNAIWGRTFALLTGDFLFTKVYELMAPYDNLNVVLAEGAIALVEGETLQAAAVKENKLTSETYMQIIGLKTAALFRSGAIIGGRLAGATEKEIEALSTFGYNVGLAFQIIDDILDLTGSDEQLGKTSGIDRTQGKGISSVTDVSDSIKNKLLEGDRLERARAQAKGLVTQAIEVLEVIPASPYRDELVNLAHSVINRKR